MDPQHQQTSWSRITGDKRSRSLLMAVNAAFWYGAWAFYSNYAHGNRTAALAALTQAAVSLTVTFLVTMIMEIISQRCRNRVVAMILAATGAISFVMIYSVTFHYMMGTPEILATLAPVWALGIVYCITYSITLNLLAQRAKNL